jgi:poly-gamma-glutamate synthesis protein (capsule biosynthesis protein)
MSLHRLPRTPRELFRLPWYQKLLYGALIALFKATGLWKHSRKASGDIETMTLMDRVYWLYKTEYPIRFPRKHSGLEEHFERQKSFEFRLPAGFVEEGHCRLTAVGDLINHAYLKNSRDSLYDDVAHLVFEGDLRMANLECPIVPQADKAFEFSFTEAPPLYYDLEELDIVKGVSGRQFDFMATACNHSLDFGLDGAARTMETLSRPRIVNRARLNDGVSQIDFTQIQRQLAHCRSERVDLVIAHMHWGLEHEFYPTPEQVELAHYLAELGVHAVIGHHPHVVQPVEYYVPRRDPDRVVPIFYSLGNLVNAFSAPYLCVSGVAQIDLTVGRSRTGSRAVYVRDARLRQIRQTVDAENRKLVLIPNDCSMDDPQGRA